MAINRIGRMAIKQTHLYKGNTSPLKTAARDYNNSDYNNRFQTATVPNSILEAWLIHQVPSNLAIIHQKAIINQENESEKQRIYSILKKLDEWVNEKKDEKAIRLNIMDKIEIINGTPQIKGNLHLSGCTIPSSLPNGLTVLGNLELSGRTGLTSLPNGLTVGEDLTIFNCYGLASLPKGLTVHKTITLIRCTRLTSLPDGLTVHVHLDLRYCSNLTSLPDELTVHGNLDLSRCAGLTSLPNELTVGGDLHLFGCTNLTSLPDWVFNLNSNQIVNARNTGIPVRLIAMYNSRQNEAGYSGPRLLFSVRDYHSTDVNAASLPNLVCDVKGLQNSVPHSLWAFAKRETEAGSLFNSFAIFLSRLMNELPAGMPGNRHLLELKTRLATLFQKMESEYEEKGCHLSQCDLINDILSAAEMAVGTCIDKVKVGYVFMQLFLKRDFENDLNKMNAIIKMVEDISAQRILFDQNTGQFIHVASAIQDGEGFEHVDKRRAILLQVMNRESESDFEQDELTRILYNEELQKSMKKDELEQYLAEKLIEKHPTMRSLRIGDDVEDILNLAYELLGTDFHKIDMRYKSCCSLIDTKKSAAIAYITDIIENKKD